MNLFVDFVVEDEIVVRQSEVKQRNNHVYAALESNGYPSKLIHDLQTKKTRPPPNLPPEELVGMFFNLVESTESRKSFASLPYIKGVTEPLTRVLKNMISRSQISH